MIARSHEVDLIDSWRADSQGLSMARFRNYPMKTPQARERLELFFPDRPKSIAHNDLRSEIRNRKDDPFYQISTLRRFHRTKTLKRHAAVHSTVLVAWARLAAGNVKTDGLARLSVGH